MSAMFCDLCNRTIQMDDAVYRYQVVKPDGVVEAYHAQHAECHDLEANTKGQRVRITCDGTDFSHARATIVQPDGTEIPISQIITACTISLAENRMNTAVVTFEGVELRVLGRATNPVYIQA